MENDELKEKEDTTPTESEIVATLRAQYEKELADVKARLADKDKTIKELLAKPVVATDADTDDNTPPTEEAYIKGVVANLEAKLKKRYDNL